MGLCKGLSNSSNFYTTSSLSETILIGWSKLIINGYIRVWSFSVGFIQLHGFWAQSSKGSGRLSFKSSLGIFQSLEPGMKTVEGFKFRVLGF